MAGKILKNRPVYSIFSAPVLALYSNFISHNCKFALLPFFFVQISLPAAKGLPCKILTDCRVLLLTVWGILHTTTAFAYGGQALILNEKIQHLHLAPYIEILEDPDHEWTIQDVILPPLNNQFHAVGKNAVNQGLTRSTFWLRFTLMDRTGPGSPGFVLDFNRPPVLNIEFYIPDPKSSGDWKIQRAGDVDGGLIPNPRRMLVFSLPIEKNTPVQCYLRVFSPYTPLFLPITVHAKDAYQDRQLVRMYWLGVNLGVGLAVILFNLCIFFSFGDKSYLFYVLYALAWTLYCLEFTGIAGRYLLPYIPKVIGFGNLSHRFSYISLGSGILFASLFTRSFLMTRKTSPLTDLGLKFVSGLSGSMIILGFVMDNLLLNQIAGVIGLLTPAVFITAGIRVWHLGFKPARFFVLAWSILLTFGFIYALAFMGVLPLSLSLYKLYQAGQSIELLLLSFALGDRIKTLREERESLKKRERRLIELSVTDGLTGLYNRRFLLSKITSEVNHAERMHQPLSLFMIDLDDFKQYNDQFGHPEGDKVLTVLADMIRHSIRERDCACRYGGEEFTVILPEIKQEEAFIVAERIRKNFGSHAFKPLDNAAIQKTVSIGLAEFFHSDKDGMNLIRRADKALYRAKSEGKNRTVIYG